MGTGRARFTLQAWHHTQPVAPTDFGQDVFLFLDSLLGQE